MVMMIYLSHAERHNIYTYIIITSAQKVASSKYLYIGYWFRASLGGVNLTMTTVNIGTYRHCVFCVRSRPNQ